MDLNCNIIPEKVETIHLIAVCGTGMAALAAMLKDLGYSVSGSDQNVYPPMSDFLAEKGIAVTSGFRAENLNHRPDLVVVGNAVSKDNPEVAAMLAAGRCFCSMPQALNHFVAAGKKPIVITGTHGKTTTASLAAWLLFKAGLDPSFMIGGILKNFGSNYRLGAGEYIVIEGDEYDTAFFDKGAKFLHYRPHLAILTSVEFDHADIFRDLAHVKQVFRQMTSRLPQESTLIAYDDDPNVRAVITGIESGVEFYGRRPDSRWRLAADRIEAPLTAFEVLKDGAAYAVLRTPMVGRHNLLNALATIAVADHLDIPTAIIGEALESFQGVRRRQEVRGCRHGITVMDDFAHHPTAVRETIAAVRPFYPRGRLIAVFEPRTNTSMRAVFQDVYPLCFDQADMVCIRRPPLLKKIPEGQRFSSEKLVQDLQQRGKAAHFFEATEAIIEFLAQEARDGDVVLIMSNGGFDNIHKRLLERL
ncbi:MAG: UDP-N-acetylmuramate:L-alanyl-gamma-D-glutamyl-meso-diaminopimelate ligase [Desulfobacterales bacterium]